MGQEMNGQYAYAVIRVRCKRVFKPHDFPVSTICLQPRKMASLQESTGSNRDLGYPCLMCPTPPFCRQQHLP